MEQVKRSSFRSLVKLFHILSSAHLSWAGSQVLSFLTILFNILLLGTSAWLLSKSALQPAISTLGLAIVGVRFYGISRAVCRYAERYISHNMAFHGLYDLRMWLYRSMMPLRPSILGKLGIGDLLSRLMGDVEVLQFFFLRVLIPPVSAVLITIGFAWYLSYYSMGLVVLLLVAFVLGGIVFPAFVLKYNATSSKRLLEQKAAVKTNIVESLNGMLDIVSFNRREDVKSTLIALYEKEEDYHERVETGYNLGRVAFLALVQCTMVLALFMGAMLLQGESLENLIYVAVIAISVQSYFEALQPMTETFNFAKESMHAMSRMEAIEDLREDEAEPVVQDLVSDAAIAFEHVNFSYGEEVLFQDFSLSIEPGEKVAIVGASGSGKSTLFAMLERLLPYEGTLVLAGKDLQSYTEMESRNLMTVMDQNPYIFHATLEENIRLARPTATDEELMDAVTFSALAPLVASLPKGLQTMIGQGGMSLSGGEKQRVALARLYLHQKDIFLLDEPLEGLDAVTAKQLQGALSSIWRDKTVLFITHRMQGLDQMDRIIMMEKGRIKEEGTYQELMSKKGTFYQYVQLSMIGM